MRIAFHTLSIIVAISVFVNGRIGLKNIYAWGKQNAKLGVTESKWHRTTRSVLKHGSDSYISGENNSTNTTVDGNALDTNETITDDTLKDMVLDWIQETIGIMGAVNEDHHVQIPNLDSSDEYATPALTIQTIDYQKLDAMLDDMTPAPENDTEAVGGNRSLTLDEAMEQYEDGETTTEKVDPKAVKEELQSWMKDMSSVLEAVKKFSRNGFADDNTALLRTLPKIDLHDEMSVHKQLGIVLSSSPPTLTYNTKRVDSTKHPTFFRHGTEATSTPSQNSTLHTNDTQRHIQDDFIFDYGDPGGAGDLFDNIGEQGNDYGPEFTPDLISMVADMTTLVSTEPASTVHPVIAEARKHKEEHKVGYFKTFVSQLFFMIAKKDDKHVQELSRGTELVLTELDRTGQLDILGRPFLPALIQVLPIISGMPGDAMKLQTLMAHAMMEHEDDAVANDIAEITRLIDAMYIDTEGEELIETLILVHEYPNNNLTNVQVMQKIIADKLLKPYRRLRGSEQLKTVINKINQSIQLHFPLITRKHYQNSRRALHIEPLKYRKNSNERNKRDWKRLTTGTASEPFSQKYSNKHKSSNKHLKRGRKQTKFRKAVEHLKDNHPKIYKKYIKNHGHRNRKNNKPRRKHKRNPLERPDHNYEKLLRDRDAKTVNSDKTKESSSIEHTTENLMRNINKDFQKRFTIVTTTPGTRAIQKYTKTKRSSMIDKKNHKRNTTPNRKVKKGSLKSKHSRNYPLTLTKMPISTKQNRILQNISEESGDSNKEDLLNPFEMRRFNKVKRRNRITELSSYSVDEEVVLKSNIYKAFGYNRDLMEETD